MKLKTFYVLHWIIFLPLILPIFLGQSIFRAILVAIKELITLIISDCVDTSFSQSSQS